MLNHSAEADAANFDFYSLLVQVSQAIAEADDVDAALHGVLATVCQHTAWEYGEIWLPNQPTTATISARYLYCSPIWCGQPERFNEFRAVTQATQFAWGVGLPGRVAATLQPEWHADVRSIRGLTFLRKEAAIAANLGAALGVPIFSGDRLLAVLVLFRSDAHAQVAAEVNLISSVAAQLGVLMQLHEAKVALLHNEQRLTTLIDSLPGIVFHASVDNDWEMRYLSQGCLALTGYHATELAGHQQRQTYNAITHPDDLARVLAIIDTAVKTHEPYVVEYRIRTKAGTERWLWEKGYAVYNEFGLPTRLEGFITDITERHQVEMALVQREHYLAAVVQVQQTLLDADPAIALTDLYQTVLTILGEATSATQVALYLRPTAAASAATVWQQQANWQEAGTPGTEPPSPQLPAALTWADWPAPWRSQLRQGQAIQTAIASAPTAAEQALLTQWQIPSLFVLPLQRDTQVVGCLCFVISTTTALSCQTTDIELLRAAAAAICLAEEHQRTKASLTAAEAKYRSIFENSVEGIFQSTTAGQYQTVNHMLAKIYGYASPADLIANLTNIEQQLYVDPQRRLKFTALMAEQGAVQGFESQVYRQDGQIIWISESARARYDDQGNLLGYEGTVEEITQRKQSELELLRRDDLFQGVARAATCLLTQSEIPQAIAEALAILGEAAQADRVYIYENHPHPETGDMSMSMRYEWTAPTVPGSIQQEHWQNQPYKNFGMQRWYDQFMQRRSIRGEVETFPRAEQAILRRDGIQSILMVPIFLDDTLWGYVGFDACQEVRQWSASDESILVAIAASLGGTFKRQYTEAQMRYQAFHDSLTGLPNRMLFNQHLPMEIAHARRTQERVGVLFIDLDRFKTINDTLGHAIGDQLLRQATQRLQSALREEDLIARWGGDEFTLILPRLQAPKDAAKLAKRLIEQFSQPFLLAEHELYVTSSIGIALYPDDGDNLDTLLQNADAALYRAKDAGRNTFQFYTASLNHQASERLQIESWLHHALAKDEFEVWYQPQVNVLTGQITKLEALLRWRHQRHGLISPAKFIPIAEETGLIVPIGAWILATACQQARTWQQQGMVFDRISVNLSARQFQQPDLLSQVQQLLAETGLEPQQLELEITETAAMQDVEFTRRTLEQLRAFGVHVAMDDFGTGYSSLNYLKRFPLNTLKIDQSFVYDLIHEPDDEAIVASIIALGKSFALNVVAEGVETEAQAHHLYQLGCQEMQGYWFSRPLPAAEMSAFLQRQVNIPQALVLVQP